MSQVKTKKDLAVQTGRNLKHLRLKHKLSMDRVVRVVGEIGYETNLNAYSNYESGNATANLFVLRALSLFYQVSIEDLCFKNLTTTT